MFRGESDSDVTVKRIVDGPTDNDQTRSHNRQFSADDCKKMNLKVTMLEDDHEFQDLVLSVHHSTLLTFNSTAAIKIIENQAGKAHIVESNPPAPRQ